MEDPAFNYIVTSQINLFKYLTITLYSGGNGINMDWLDGMTGCGGECNIGGSSVTFSGFELW